MRESVREELFWVWELNGSEKWGLIIEEILEVFDKGFWDVFIFYIYSFVFFIKY